MNNLSLKQGGGLKGSAAHMNAPPPRRVLRLVTQLEIATI